jgi:endonuclease YncB( thermonuclease family)
MRLAALLALVLTALSSGASAAMIAGTVIGITDGDTITVLAGRRQLKVRLSDIDAPEREQAFGARSRQRLGGLCFRQPAKIDDRGRDRYGRILGHVTCAGKDANAEQVRSGMAWVYDGSVTSSAMYRRELYRLEDAARNGRRGLWADRKPIPPWEWRRWKK